MRVHVVTPNDIDDPARPSGGNVYDRRLIDGLRTLGWLVREHPVRGGWPRPSRDDRARLAGIVARLPDSAVVVVDGLIASAVPEVLGPHAHRLRLVVLVHMPLGDHEAGPARSREARVLSSVAAVVTTSRWSGQRLAELYGLPPWRVHVATPGADPAPLAPATTAGTRLLCVAAVTHHKGHDVLVRSLARLADLPWHCVCVGALDQEPSFVEGLRHYVRRTLADRITFVGAHAWRSLRDCYTRADLLVLPSRGETYGMVVTEALAHGIPVMATAAKGLPEALGHAHDGSRPGVLVPPEDAPALAETLRHWLVEPDLRARWRDSARSRRTTLATWASTAEAFATVLSHVTDDTRIHSGR